MTAFRNIKLLIGAALVILIVLAALFAPLLAPNDPESVNMLYRYAMPSKMFPLGADAYGRCILSRLLHGARYSLGIALIVIFIVAVTAVPAGMAAAYHGGITEKVFLWVCNISMALPPMVLILAIMGIMGNGIVNLIFTSAFSYWGWYSRMVRSYTLSEVGRSYVAYAMLGGCSSNRILYKHLMPNVMPKLIILFMLGIGKTILMISGYSFLGIGLPAGAPEWGAMLAEAKSLLIQTPRFAIYPGICVFVTVCAFNLTGEAMQDQLSVNQKAV